MYAIAEIIKYFGYDELIFALLGFRIVVAVFRLIF